MLLRPILDTVVSESIYARWSLPEELISRLLRDFQTLHFRGWEMKTHWNLEYKILEIPWLSQNITGVHQRLQHSKYSGSHSSTANQLAEVGLTGLDHIHRGSGHAVLTICPNLCRWLAPGAMLEKNLKSLFPRVKAFELILYRYIKRNS